MSKRQYKFGPWEVDDYDGKSTREIIDAEGRTVCEVVNESREDEAKQRLIAAAPELLEALRPFAGGNWTKELADQARAAIAKATGNVHRDNPANESVRDAVDAATRVSSWSAQ